MMLYLFNLFLCIGQLLIYSSFTIDKPFLKFVLEIIMILIIILLFKKAFNNPVIKPGVTHHTLGDVMTFYTIKDNWAYVWNVFMLTFYLSLTVGSIFLLRFSNIYKTLDLKLLYKNVYNSLMSHTFAMNLLNITFVFLVIILIILSLAALSYKFKRFFIRLHLYHHGGIKSEWYWNKFLIFIERNSIPTLTENVFEKVMFVILTYYYGLSSVPKIARAGIEDSDEYKFIWQKFLDIRWYSWPVVGGNLEFHLLVFATHFHYIMLCLVLIYDIMYNDYILSTVYLIFPFVYIYDLWLRCYYAYRSTIYHIDNALHALLYEEFSVFNEDEYLLGDLIFGYSIEKEKLHGYVDFYLLPGLDAKSYKKFDKNEPYFDGHYKYPNPLKHLFNKIYSK